jgi:hypothetical protein
MLSRTPYMRNLWMIMKTFNVLPTNDEFRNLSDDQIDLILFNMMEDNREMEMARKGLTTDSQHYDSSFEEEVWNKAEGEWDVLKEGHDPNDIARQVDQLTREEERKNLAMKFDSLEEYNAFREAGGKTGRESEIDEYISRQIAIAEEKALRLEATKGKKKLVNDTDLPEIANNNPLGKSVTDLDKEAMDKSIALFNAQDDDFTEI